jgi:hypothetical protein
MQASERGGQRHEIAHWACATGPGADVRERPLGVETCRLGAPVKQRSRALGSLPWMEAIPKIRYTLFLRSRCVFV